MAVYISSEASEINHSQAADESEAEGSDPGVGYTTPKRGRRYFSSDDEELETIMSKLRKKKQKVSASRKTLQSGRDKENRSSAQMSPQAEKNGSNSELVKEMKRNNELLLDILDRVKKTEGRLRVVENQLKDHVPSSSSSTPAKQRFREVPDEVRVSITQIFRASVLFIPLPLPDFTYFSSYK